MAPRARPPPARWPPRLQLHAEAASESPGTLTPLPRCDPVYPTPPPHPLRPGCEVSAPTRDAANRPPRGRERPRQLGCGASPHQGGGGPAGRAQGGRRVGLHPCSRSAPPPASGSAMTVESPFGILSIWQCHGAGEDL